jgi:thiol-disulfide isomerase/thioredoxin
MNSTTSPRRQWLQAALGLAAGVTLPPWVHAAEAEPAARGARVHWPAVTLLDGSLLSPASLPNTALVLVFFATSCPYCRRHNEHVQKLVKATRGQPLRVLGVAGDREPQAVRDYLRLQGYSFAVTLDEAPLRAALTRRQGIPLTCVLDRAGRLRELIPGEMFEEDVLGLARWASVS